MKLMTFTLVIVFLSLMLVGQTLREYNIEENETFNIYNFTENNLVWDYNYSTTIKLNVSNISNINLNNIQSNRIINIIDKSIDYGGYVIFEISKWGLEFGYTHPQYHFKTIINIMIGLMILSILPALIPIIALFYLIFEGIKWLIKKAKLMLNRRKTI